MTPTAMRLMHSSVAAGFRRTRLAGRLKPAATPQSRMSRMVRRRLFCPAAARRVRSARAVRPCRPITLPGSFGATSSSMMVWSPRSYARVLTASASSTSDLATNSMSSFTLLRFGLLQDRLDGGRNLGALGNPVVDARAVDLDVRRILLGVVVADLLDRRRARGLQRVGDDDPVEGGVSRAAAAQANLQHEFVTP